MLRHLDGVVSPWAAASPFGIGTHPSVGLEEIDPLAEIGAKWVRIHLAPWAEVERGPGVYTFAPELDRLVEACHEADIQILGLLGYEELSSSGARNATAPPGRVEAYASYVHAAVSHYRRWTKHWEIGDDPDAGGLGGGRFSPDAYAELLRAGYRAAKAADRHCTVVGGGVAGGSGPFLERLLALGATRHMDVLSVGAGTPSPDVAGEVSVVARLQAARDLASLHRRGLPVWLTGAGWSTSSSDGSASVSPQTQADYLVRLYVLSLAAGAERVFWRSFRDDGRFGLVQPDLTPKPAYAAYRTMTRLLEGAVGHGRVEAPHGVQGVAFGKHNQDILVCWAPEGVVEVELLGTDISRWDIAGQASRAADGPLRLALGPSPVYAVGHSLRLAAR